MCALREYLDIDWLLSHESIRQDRADQREDGLESEHLKRSPYQQLVWWMQKYRHRIEGDEAQRVDESLRYLSWTIVIIMYVVGIGTGRTLLEYGGGELVNIVSFFIVLVAIPFLFSVSSLLMMLKSMILVRRRDQVPLAVRGLLSLIGTRSSALKRGVDRLYDHERLLAALAVMFLHYGSISLSLGALSALVMTVTTQDIAFGWNTTLDITPEALHQLTAMIAFPWSLALPDAVPSLELITMSRHFRLGNEIPAELIEQAKHLGGWWQFLAMSLLVWGVLARVILVVSARYRLRSLLRRTLLERHDAMMLLTYMNEPYITTTLSDQESDEESQVSSDDVSVLENASAQSVIGWNLDAQTFKSLLTKRAITAATHFLAGGKNSIEEDDAIIDDADKRVIVLVKAWEPPLREFLDFIADLADRKGSTVSVYPVGDDSQDAKARSSDIVIWKERIAALHLQNIGIDRGAL